MTTQAKEPQHPTVDAASELRYRLGGGLHEPGSPEYDEACELFNAMIETRPRYVARCNAPDDVVAALAFARNHDLEVAVRAGGHSVTGLSLREDGLVLDVRGMSDVEVDPQRRIARVGGGATWATVDEATQAHGLAAPGGRVSTTGVGGLTLGGGSGWLERKHGFACDNVEAVELVTATGELVRASKGENSELLWALRGGGGNFGVVTTFELRLHPVGPEVFGGLVMHPFESGRELLALWRDVMREAPDELSLAFMYAAIAEDDEESPPELRGKIAAVVAGMHSGTLAEGEEALRPIREFGAPAADEFGPVPYAEFQRMIDDPPGFRNYWTEEHLPDLPDAAIDAIHGRFVDPPPGIPQVFIVSWGGAMARVGEESGPLTGRDARFIVHPLALWTDPADDERVMSWGRGLRADMREFATGASYLNFAGDEGEARVRAAYGERNYERLAQVKARWDPGNVFRASGNVRPA